LPDIDYINEIKLGRLGGNEATAGGGLLIPKMADGGIVSSPTLALIGEAGPEAVVPLDRMRGMGGNVTINVTGGLATSAEIGESVVNALRAYSRSAGPLQLQVA
jgi:phage-related minor tail protein